MATASVHGQELSSYCKPQQLHLELYVIQYIPSHVLNEKSTDHCAEHKPIVPAKSANLDSRPKPQAGNQSADTKDRPVNRVDNVPPILVAVWGRSERQYCVHNVY